MSRQFFGYIKGEDGIYGNMNKVRSSRKLMKEYDL